MTQMEMVTLRGIVLREYPVGESDKFIHVLSKERGFIEISVRGGRKTVSKNAGGSQLFAYSVFSVRCDKGRYYLDSCQPINIFYKIREDLQRLSLAGYIAEVISYTSGQHEQKNDVMRLVLNTFHFLAEGSRECNLLKSVFELRLMTEIGMMPDIVCCAVCMNYMSENMCFDVLSAKLYCGSCIKDHGANDTAMRLKGSVVHAMRHIVFSDFDRLFNFRLSPQNMKRLSQVTERYMLLHLDRGFKTLDFYHSVM